jgi:hypothetical protein
MFERLVKSHKNPTFLHRKSEEPSIRDLLVPENSLQKGIGQTDPVVPNGPESIQLGIRHGPQEACLAEGAWPPFRIIEGVEPIRRDSIVPMVVIGERDKNIHIKKIPSQSRPLAQP